MNVFSPTLTPAVAPQVVALHKAPLPRRCPLSAVYRKAARLIAVNGHHQGDYCPDPFDRKSRTPHAERPLSIVAAIRCAVSASPHRATELSEAAVKVLAYRLEVEGEPPWSDAPRWLENHVDCWGDAPGRTAECAVAVLEAAADASEVAA
ncbi:MAG TPA: hypothetical protein VFF37_08375 [Streptomyces sp.]|nr:hypothetical protein [Streptomyces sp.]